MSSTDTGEDPAVNSKSDNIEIMIYIMILTNFLITSFQISNWY